MKKALLVAGLALAACNLGAQAQMKPATPADVAPLKNALGDNFDKLFVLHASMGNKAEVALGKLAMMRSKSPDVLMIAKTTATQHAKADMDLTKAAKALGYPVPKDAGLANMATYKMLSGLRGTAFDKAYLAVLVGGHEQTIVLLQHEIEHGKASTLKAFATNKLPDILGHASMIYTAAGKHMAPGADMRPAPVKQAAMSVDMKLMGKM
ncbi:hypothetical protein IAD21_02050 [Abditibacteriota bacterium]|nr:hypothetical protein IAD21_02050 [Abditibacteriota bacterium]